MAQRVRWGGRVRGDGRATCTVPTPHAPSSGSHRGWTGVGSTSLGRHSLELEVTKADSPLPPEKARGALPRQPNASAGEMETNTRPDARPDVPKHPGGSRGQVETAEAVHALATDVPQTPAAIPSRTPLGEGGAEYLGNGS